MRPEADRPLFVALASSAVLLAAAVALWGASVVASWYAKCPGAEPQPTGLDKGFSAWPPGSWCPNERSGSYVYEAMPWLKPLIVAMTLLAPLVLLIGVVVATRRLRSPHLAPARGSESRAPGSADL